MSDSESSQDFQIESDGDSEGYIQPSKSAAVKKAAAPGKKTAAASGSKGPKAPAKKPAAKKAPLAPKRTPNESVSEDDDDGFAESSPMKGGGPGGRPDDDEFENSGAKSGAGTKKNASEMYQKLSQLEHVLKRPDTYIGSVEAVTQTMWVYDAATSMMVNRNTTYVPGFFKIFDEILVNAADNKMNDPSMDTLKINIDREKNQISVYNNGRGIPVEKHQKEQIMIPELIFGHLLTSSNYDDDQKKLTGGRNGYGAKLTNIYSTEFIVETADKTNGLKYKQVFSNNMGKKTTPKVTPNPKGEEYTKITFTPDLQRFGMTAIDDDTYALLSKRVYDMAGTVKEIKVFLNNERVKIKNFKQYVEMYVKASTAAQEEAGGGGAVAKPTIVHEIVNKRWEVAFALSDGQQQQVSFANSIATTKGGTHVDMITTQLANKLLEQIKKKNKAAPVKAFQVKNHMWIFINALIENPAFDSQTKETLTLKSSAFGSKCELSEEFVKKVSKSGIIDNVLNWAKFKQDQIMKKTDGSKRTRISGIVKLEDANNAGGRNANKCTLILTEGDSAKALAVSGLSVVGRDNYGVFPLRGKLLNVRDASHDAIVKNVEISHIKQILGLKHNTDYTSTDSLRYGHLMIMTDQDHDGSHIKGLIINFLDHFYPSLLRIPEFLVEFVTPIVKTWRGKQELTFYTMPQYEEWKAENNEGKGWQYKYYKGLGTSTSADAKKYFSALEKHRLGFEAMGPEDRALIDMAFNKKKADDRKEWLRQFKPGTYLDHDVKILPVSDFVNKELILFSMADNIRSIPSVADGLKPGQRKVLYGCFKRNLTADIKVAQLAGYVSEKTAYHHGEQSLTMTIVGLAQDFVGSNNINLLEPNGQFGTRIAGGKDAASARYIYTKIPRITRAIFHPADDGILNYLFEDGAKIEPEYYLPTVPMILINGAEGIGTGWSTSIPNYNPVDIVENLRRLMRGEEPERMNPWFRGFKGSIERVEQDRYKTSGIIEKTDDKVVEIMELPIRTWTQPFKEMIEEMTTGTDKIPSSIKDYEEHHTDTTVHFKLHLSEKDMKVAEEEGLEKRFKLSSTFNTSNMVCFDLNGKIRKYASADEILLDFYHKRLEYYGLRKQHLADELNKQFDKLSNQARFVHMIITKELVVSNKKKSKVVEELRGLKFRPFPKVKKALEEGELLPAAEDEDEGSDNDYDYLLGMAIWSLTAEKVEKLMAERDTKGQELVELLKLTPQVIWNRDLDNFLAEWQLMLEADAAAAKGAKPKTKAAIKAAEKKKRRAAGDDSDESDDFMPVKAAAKKTAAKPKASGPSPVKAAAKRESAAISDGDSNARPTKKAAAAKPRASFETEDAVKLDEEDSDDDVYHVPLSKAATAAAKTKPIQKQGLLTGAGGKFKVKPAPKKQKVLDSDESDFEVTSKVTKTAAKPKSKKLESDSGDDFDMGEDDVVMPQRTQPAARAGRNAAKKPAAYIEMSDDDE